MPKPTANPTTVRMNSKELPHCARSFQIFNTNLPILNWKLKLPYTSSCTCSTIFTPFFLNFFLWEVFCYNFFNVFCLCINASAWSAIIRKLISFSLSYILPSTNFDLISYLLNNFAIICIIVDLITQDCCKNMKTQQSNVTLFLEKNKNPINWKIRQ